MYGHFFEVSITQKAINFSGYLLRRVRRIREDKREKEKERK